MNDFKKGKIIVFSAPSGAGKTTLLDYLAQHIPSLVYSISATTRKPRPGETNGEQYFFLSVDEFKKKIAEEAFAEWEKVHDNYYGTPRDFIESTIHTGKHIIMDIDVFGKAKFDKAYPEAVGILIKPPSLEALRTRLINRKTDTGDVIAVRLKNAETELHFAENSGKYEYSLVNDDLKRAQKEIVDLVSQIIAE